MRLIKYSENFNKNRVTFDENTEYLLKTHILFIKPLFINLPDFEKEIEALISPSGLYSFIGFS